MSQSFCFKCSMPIADSKVCIEDLPDNSCTCNPGLELDETMFHHAAWIERCIRGTFPDAHIERLGLDIEGERYCEPIIRVTFYFGMGRIQLEVHIHHGRIPILNDITEMASVSYRLFPVSQFHDPRFQHTTSISTSVSGFYNRLCSALKTELKYLSDQHGHYLGNRRPSPVDGDPYIMFQTPTDGEL